MVLELAENFNDLIDQIYTTEPIDFEGLTSKIIPITPKNLEQISGHKSPSHSLAIVNMPKINKSGDFTIVLDDVQDPGNLGTIIRLADWYGIQNIVCSKATVDCYNSKVVQSCMGSLFRVSIDYLDILEYIQNDPRPTYATVLNGENLYKKLKSKKGILVMGNEGNGISKEVINLCSEKLLIPRIGEAESLNVAMATAICLAAFFGE